jgi:hypothetical protein
MPHDAPQAPVPDEAQSPPTTIDVAVGGRSIVRDLLVAGRDVIVTNYRTIFSSTRQVIALLLYISLVVGLVGSTYVLWRQPSSMTGDFNIAVAQFGEIQADGNVQNTGTSARIAQALVDYLDGEYKRTSFGLQVMVDNRNMRYVANDIVAEKLARRVNAQLVIYGTLRPGGDQVTLQPHFFVARQIQTGARSRVAIGCDVDEIVGEHPFTLNLHFDPNASTDEIEAEMAGRAAVLASFTQGLVHLYNVQSDEPVLARLAFDSAIAEAQALADFRGLQTLYLFDAVANYRSQDYETARSLLDRALEIEPGYGRALIAQGNIFYYQALAGCLANGLDEKAMAYCQAGDAKAAQTYLLYRAWETYGQVSRGQRFPYGTYLQEKAWLNMGNIYLMRGQDGEVGAYERAAAYYQQVAGGYEQAPRNDEQDLAARAYRGLGQVRDRQGLEDGAAAAFQRCYELALYDESTRSECRDSLDSLAQRQKGP